MQPLRIAVFLFAAAAVGAGFWFGPEVLGSTGKAGSDDRCCHDEPAAKDAKAPEAPKAEGANVRIPDKKLIDQDGKEVRLFTDLIKGKRVIMSFIFTTCGSVCPTLTSVLEGVQEKLGDRLGEEVRIISVTVDPGTDTPERLKAFGEEFHAGPHWSFLTGDVEDINEVLRAFGVYTRVKEEHSSMFVLGDEPQARWMYMSGFVAPDAVVKQLDTLCAKK